MLKHKKWWLLLLLLLLLPLAYWGHRHWKIEQWKAALQGGDTQWLLERLQTEPDVNRPIEGVTLLGMALQAHSLPAVQLILERGANPNQPMRAGDMDSLPLDLALKAEQWELVEVLHKQGGKATFNNPQGQSILHLAAQAGRSELVKSILQQGQDANLTDLQDSTPLMLALQQGRRETVLTLLEHGAASHLVNRQGFVPINHALKNIDSELIDLMLQGSPMLVNRDEFGRLALHWAVMISGRDNWLKQIVGLTPDQHAQDIQGLTPLMIAFQQRHTRASQWLLDQSTPLELADWQGRTLLMIAAQEGLSDEVVRLIKLGANVNAMDLHQRNALFYCTLGKNPLICELLIAQQIDMQQMDSSGRNLIHYAVQTGVVEFVDFFLQHQVPANLRDHQGTTPLALAQETGNEPIIELLSLFQNN